MRVQIPLALGLLVSTGTSTPIDCVRNIFITYRRRQLPQAPNVPRPSTASTTSPTSSTSKPAVTSPHSDAPNVYKPVPAIPSHSNGTSINGVDADRVQQSESSLDLRGYSATADYIKRKPSARPPGALAPKIPGHTSMYDDSPDDLHSADDMRNRPSHRPQQSSEQFRPVDGYSQPHARLHPNDIVGAPAQFARVNDLRHRPSSSSDYIPNCKLH